MFADLYQNRLFIRTKNSIISDRAVCIQLNNVPIQALIVEKFGKINKNKHVYIQHFIRVHTNTSNVTNRCIQIEKKTQLFNLAKLCQIFFNYLSKWSPDFYTSWDSAFIYY